MKQSVVIIIVTAILAFISGIVASPFLSSNETDNSIETDTLAEVKTEYFTCPMHPHIHQDHTGDCPICGMSLISKQIEDASTSNDKSHPEIRVDPSVINNFGIKTANVVRDNIYRNIRLYGYINQVKNREDIQLKSPISGAVRFINHSDKGNKFYKNEVVVSLESDEILQLQKQYINAVSKNDVRNMRVLKQKLSTLGYSFDSLKLLTETRQPSNIYHLRYPDTGLLTQLNVKLKQKVKAGEMIGTLKPLYSISAYAKVFETQWIWLKPGQKISMTIRRFPGLSWQGEVRKVDDLGYSSTTAVKLIADFAANDKMNLRLGMQTEMIVYTESKNNVLLVPSSAVIRTGSKNVVVVEKSGGRFQPVDVVTGLDNDEHVEIISGLQEGMKVVVSGQFLLDSESELRAEVARMSSP
ncbi:MAG: efflux RND transporter periplasmic adaptor subunit, partial [Gammaproteobacteria bacterium]|nr:efflux RND transporter periplasmic adaptor subunit [Gammaproteobacteria bacterium]